jgi:hypothetical protein
VNRIDDATGEADLLADAAAELDAASAAIRDTPRGAPVEPGPAIAAT